jgi:hypothetical protein
VYGDGACVWVEGGYFGEEEDGVLSACPTIHNRPKTAATPMIHFPAEEPELGWVLEEGVGWCLGVGGGFEVSAVGRASLCDTFLTGSNCAETSMSETSEESPAKPLPSFFLLSSSDTTTFSLYGSRRKRKAEVALVAAAITRQS